MPPTLDYSSSYLQCCCATRRVPFLLLVVVICGSVWATAAAASHEEDANGTDMMTTTSTHIRLSSTNELTIKNQVHHHARHGRRQSAKRQPAWRFLPSLEENDAAAVKRNHAADECLLGACFLETDLQDHHQVSPARGQWHALLCRDHDDTDDCAASKCQHSLAAVCPATCQRPCHEWMPRQWDLAQTKNQRISPSNEEYHDNQILLLPWAGTYQQNTILEGVLGGEYSLDDDNHDDDDDNHNTFTIGVLQLISQFDDTWEYRHDMVTRAKQVQDHVARWRREREKLQQQQQGYDATASVDAQDDDGCQNQNPQCLYWSILGECETNPSFMKQKCAPSCFWCGKGVDEAR